MKVDYSLTYFSGVEIKKPQCWDKYSGALGTAYKRHKIF